ncbi:hypothetical protein LTR66_016988, partial [Elasticomyces elasticus]
MALPEISATWQGAFTTHPIPTVRIVEKQLRASASRDKERLRVLVGGTYRDVLTTAENIVDLGHKTRGAEGRISSLGQACRPPDFENQLAGCDDHIKTVVSVHLATQLLRSVAKAIHAADVLSAARMIILAQLLLTDHSQNGTNSPRLAWLAAQLKNTRSKFARDLDMLFVRPTTGLKKLIAAMSAYCLLTSSSAIEAVAYISNLRLGRLKQDSEKMSRSQLTEKCNYVINSCLALKTLFTRPVSEVLIDLQKKPLINDEQLRLYDGLNLEQFYRFLSDDVVHFTPYLKKSAL